MLDCSESDPAAGAVLDHAPVEIFAWFSQPLSTGSRLSVFDDQFQPVDKGQTFIDASDATLMRTQVQHLEPGRLYRQLESQQCGWTRIKRFL